MDEYGIIFLILHIQQIQYMSKKAELFSIKKTLIYFLLLAVIVTITYANHFSNSFHFDDSHTIQNNLFIQDISNIPLFFKDGTTFSSLPTNQSYRPIVSASLAIDYWLGSGYNLFYFHLSTFILFLLQGACMFLLFFKLLNSAYTHRWNFFIALIAVALYLLHPANAETVNYIIARSDIQSSFFVILGFCLYMYSPFFKKTFLYLLPVAIGILAKPPAAMFAPLFFLYVLLFEQKMSVMAVFNKQHLKQFISVVKTALPAFIVCGLMYLLVDRMTPKTWIPGGSSTFNYLITQPSVIVHYFTTFFLPIGLSADTDWVPLETIWNASFFIGCAFIFTLLYIAFKFSNDEKLRPISFGILWFFLALLPTSVIPLSEVLNDHRIFFPYVGLTIAVCHTIALLLLSYKKQLDALFINKTILISCLLIVLGGYAYGTHQRNSVWHTEESLWKDVTIKSPKNGRGLMNYGLAKMEQGDYAEADNYFNKALAVWPYYTFLHVNIGVLKSAQGDNATAEIFFKNAIAYGTNYPDSYYFYGKFLSSQLRHKEAIDLLTKAIELSPAHIGARSLLMHEYIETEEWDKLTPLANTTLEINPGNLQALIALDAATNKKGKIEIALDELKKAPSADNYLNLSLLYYQAEKYQECIDAATEAITIKPEFAEAYNNIGSAYNILKKWDDAIKAFEKALQINPNFELAKNNLFVAQKGKNDFNTIQKLVIEKPSSDNYINLSLLYYNQGLYEKSIEVCKKAIQLKPDNANAYNNIAAAYCELKQWDKAIDACTKALQIDPTHPLATGNLNWAKQEKQKIK